MLSPKSIRPFAHLNPMMPVVVAYRMLFLEGTFYFKYCLLSLLYGLILVAFGYMVYSRLKWKFAELL